MKKITQLTTFVLLFGLASRGRAQLQLSLCPDSIATLTALNSASLTSPTYSMNPGGMISSTPFFTVSPSVSQTYTLYVTGTNSGSALVTTTSTTHVQMSGPLYNLFSPSAYTLGCNSASVCAISIQNAQTVPFGGAVTYTFIPPGSSTIISVGALSTLSQATVTIPGVWTVAVRDILSGCTTRSTVTVFSNTTSPVVPPVIVPQATLDCATPSVALQFAPSAGHQYNWLPNGIQSTSLTVSTNPSAPSSTVITTLTLTVTDINNSCQSSTVINMYQNIFEPVPTIVTGSPPLPCTHTLVLSHTSTSGIPPGTFSGSGSVVGFLWQGPAPQSNLSMSSTYTAQVSGIYSLTAMDLNNGCVKTGTYNIVLTPLAAFLHTLSSGQATFNNISTNTGTATSYFWDFGDGNTSTLENPTHSYTGAGAHLVKFKITRYMFNIPCSDSVIQAVNISGIPCVANSGFSLAPTATAQVWDATPSYPWNVVAAQWSWGDGTFSNSLYTSHQYAVAGLYNICLSVTVSCVGSSSTCTSYSVFRVAESAQILEVRVVAPEMITGLSNLKKDEQFHWNIVPNPNAGTFNLHFESGNLSPLQLNVTDLSGNIVYKQLITNPSDSALVRMEALPNGIYFLSIEKAGMKQTKRLVMIH